MRSCFPSSPSSRREKERDTHIAMATTAPYHLFLCLVFLLPGLGVGFSSPGAVHLPLRQIAPAAAPETAAVRPDSFEQLARLVTASLLRARRLKDPQNGAGSSSSSIPFSRVPLFSHSYGGYAVSFGFGTPPQQIPLVLDTGSDLVWVPCTKSYHCSNCNATANVPIFVPRSSSSARLIGCRNPKCTWFHTPQFLSRCRDCPLNATAADNCSPVCPPYMLLYGSGSTGGLLLSETLQISPQAAAVSNFVVGCSLFSSKQPAAGIAGFGRGPASLPSQLGLARFSYCLISRRYDDAAGESGSVVLGGARESSSGDGLAFTPFLKNPAVGSPFSVYYYLGLRKITVNGQKVKIPHAALMPVPSGNGGIIIDSGTTFTYMDPMVFEPVAGAIEDAVAGRYNRSTAAEELTGLRPCFSLATAAAAAATEEVRLPVLAFHFKGGAEMRLPLSNYFIIAGDSGAVCLTIVTDAGDAAGAGGGPSVILGNFQQQNYYVVYDLERERMGFRQQSCLEKH